MNIQEFENNLHIRTCLIILADGYIHDGSDRKVARFARTVCCCYLCSFSQVSLSIVYPGLDQCPMPINDDQYHWHWLAVVKRTSKKSTSGSTWPCLLVKIKCFGYAVLPPLVMYWQFLLIFYWCLDPALFSWSALRGIDRNWLAMIGIERHFGSMPRFW